MFQQQQRGLDELNRAMMITALVLTILGMFFAQLGGWLRFVFTGLGAVLLVLMVLRMTSKNTAKRYQENMKYLTYETAVKDWFRRTFRAKSAGGAYQAPRAKRAGKNPTGSMLVPPPSGSPGSYARHRSAAATRASRSSSRSPW